MLDLLFEPESNPDLRAGVSLRPPGRNSSEPSVRSGTVFDLLYLATEWTVDGGFPPYDDPEGRWRCVCRISLFLIAREADPEGVIVTQRDICAIVRDSLVTEEKSDPGTPCGGKCNDRGV